MIDVRRLIPLLWVTVVYCTATAAARRLSAAVHQASINSIRLKIIYYASKHTIKNDKICIKNALENAKV